MLHKALSGGSFYLFAPVAIVVACAGIWVATAATFENLRVGRATDLFISAVSHARDAGLSANMDEKSAKRILFNRFSAFDNLSVTTLPGDKQGEAESVLIGPWGAPVHVFVYPPVRAVRFESVVPGVACHKILRFYAKDAVSLGHLRVDVRDHLPSALWRLVYEQPRDAGQGGIDGTAIEAGCGTSSSVILSLTFTLK